MVTEQSVWTNKLNKSFNKKKKTERDWGVTRTEQDLEEQSKYSNLAAEANE